MLPKSKRIRFGALIGLALLIFAASPAAAFQKGKDTLPAVFQKWLDEDVVYIITPAEKDVFLQLATDRERVLFIEAFWKRRDPVPATLENEFKTEHLRRMLYADKNFGRSSPKPGWKTDRGRMYIILGEPSDIQRYTGRADVYDAEVWFYEAAKSGPFPGLPAAAFHLVFFKKGFQGDYVLYSPVSDGPQGLLRAYTGKANDYEAAYESLRDIDPNLAVLSLSLITGEPMGSLGRPSLSSDILLTKISELPSRQVDPGYAAQFLKFKDIVEVEYTANFLDSDGTVAVLRDPSGMFFVHYAIEPVRLSLEAAGSEYVTTLHLNGAVAAEDGRAVYQFEKTIAVRMDESRRQELDRVPFVAEDLFPLIPGTFKVSILLKNEASKEFCSLERTVVIPGPASGIGLTAPLLGYRARIAAPDRPGLRPFRFGAAQVYFQGNRALTSSDNLVLAFMILGLDDAALSKTRLRFEVARDDVAVKNWEREASSLIDVPFVVESVPAGEFPPGHYAAKIRLFVDGREIAAASEPFERSPLETISRPWIHAILMPAAGDPSYDGILGRQYEATGRTAEARILLEKAITAGAVTPESATALARIYRRSGMHAAVVSFLDPFLADPAKSVYDMWLMAAESLMNIGRFERAVEVINRAIARFGVNATLLNLLGDANLGWDRPADARSAWERSLALNPDQPAIRKKLAALKGPDRGGARS